MATQALLIRKLNDSLKPTHLEVSNESHMHNVPADSETHFRVVVVSDLFEGLALVKRHRAVNEVVAEELANRIHALALHTYTPEEYEARHGATPESPDCLGGSKSDA